jgi:hypothetical protein
MVDIKIIPKNFYLHRKKLDFERSGLYFDAELHCKRHSRLGETARVSASAFWQRRRALTRPPDVKCRVHQG